ncbi:MAG: ThuA domain-containing protein, partial [Planctomycetota bacterium]
MVLSVVSCLSMQAGVLKGEITDDELQMIRKAVPKTATAKPIKPRKLLVFNRAKGLIHTSIPYATKAIQLMAEKTGAFEVVVSDDMSIFNPESLESFDAICFNNSNR